MCLTMTLCFLDHYLVALPNAIICWRHIFLFHFVPFWSCYVIIYSYGEALDYSVLTLSFYGKILLRM